MILLTANELQLKRIIEKCMTTIESAMSVKNCHCYLEFANRNKNEELMNMCQNSKFFGVTNVDKN